VFQWVEPIEWARHQVQSAKAGGLPTTGRIEDYQHSISITEAGVLSQTPEFRASLLATEEIDYVWFERESEGGETFILMNIIDKEPSSSTFALDCTVTVDDLMRWFKKFGIATEDQTGEA
jgi:hypothetical protein